MDWEKVISRSAGERRWADDFPLHEKLPEALVLNCSELREPIHPLLAVRLRAFVDWHRSAGRRVEVVAPTDSAARTLFRSMAIDDLGAAEPNSNSIVPVTRLRDYTDVENAAAKAREILEYQLTDVSPLGAATFMAVSELCGNALEHGANTTGALVCVRRVTEPRPTAAIAISDLGIGIPEHIRQRYPEWSEDGFAIGRAIQRGISGVNDPHRGNGFSETFDAALTSALHAATLEIHSASGFIRDEIVQEGHNLQSFPPANFRRGTWVVFELLSV